MGRARAPRENRDRGDAVVFETYYPEGAEPQEAGERYRDVPLGVEAAWPPPEEPVSASPPRPRLPA